LLRHHRSFEDAAKQDVERCNKEDSIGYLSSSVAATEDALLRVIAA
jgi:hypothetical protein